ncbi:uncharacterized protein LACBIDRAFT_304780 [Laccaria bicolor S238N-H82]|uniref:Predicted protein n=1 Tax=Laccaria bicolor (strain S238N-H82 / ATCC MYA-4686) TaxID=486041 RepID=B0DMB4_LACBS|nr:uncharacterized protein LACBIDRAFT_304780 [Laccaria bicolor S238N-H82]EDR04251.1 predicted protein [Laccaria bicolor S238N-H82]|eukprot:XP_001885142.1 predicted protein [Laccaria bicolor S238N-H82]
MFSHWFRNPSIRLFLHLGEGGNYETDHCDQPICLGIDDPRQVTYAWSCPRSLGLILFYMNRYLPFIDQSLVLYSKISISCIIFSDIIAVKFAAIPPKVHPSDRTRLYPY